MSGLIRIAAAPKHEPHVASSTIMVNRFTMRDPRPRRVILLLHLSGQLGICPARLWRKLFDDGFAPQVGFPRFNRLLLQKRQRRRRERPHATLKSLHDVKAERALHRLADLL